MLFEDVQGMSLPTADDFINKLIPNWVSFVAQLAALVVLIVVVIIFAYKPVKKMVQKRQDYIEANIHDSEINKARANENLLKSEEMVIASEKKANEIIASASIAAKAEQSRIIEETNNIVAKMKIDAEADIEKSKQDAKDEIRKEMVDLALDASSAILKREISDEDNARLADDFIRSVKK